MRHFAERCSPEGIGHPPVVRTDLGSRVGVQRCAPPSDQLVTANAAEDETAVLVKGEAVGEVVQCFHGIALRAQLARHGTGTARCSLVAVAGRG